MFHKHGEQVISMKVVKRAHIMPLEQLEPRFRKFSAKTGSRTRHLALGWTGCAQNPYVSFDLFQVHKANHVITLGSICHVATMGGRHRVWFQQTQLTPAEQENCSGPCSTLALSLTKHINSFRQKQSRFAFLSPRLPVLFFFIKNSEDMFLPTFESCNFTLLLQNWSKKKQNKHPRSPSAPLLII